MPNGETNLLNSLHNIWPVGLLSLIGGILDYLYAMQSGNRIWSLASFVLHLAFSFFVGYLCALSMVGLGYSVEIAGAAAGAAGFLNIRLIDLIVYFIKQRGHKHG